MEELNRFSQGFNQPLYFREGLSLPIKRLYKEFRAEDHTSVLVLESIIFDILANVERFNTKFSTPVKPGWLSRTKDFIHENALRGVSLSDAAVVAEVHPSYLARAFRKYYHCSISDYVKKVRLDFAAEQILKTNKTLSEIALEAGFYDQSHFNSAFKFYTKMTPGEFRRLSVKS